jgi:uncharacterized membrane protein YtjA (UPF0391 family)
MVQLNNVPLPPEFHAHQQTILELLQGCFVFKAYQRRSVRLKLKRKDVIMLNWAFIFLVVAIAAAVFGFGGIASASAGIAQILFFVFLTLFAVTLIANVVGRVSR